MISCSFILAELSMLLRERMKLIGWFLSHDLLCPCGILKSLDVFISMRRGRAWIKRAHRTRYIISAFPISVLAPPPPRIFCMSRLVNRPDSDHQLVRRELRAWTVPIDMLPTQCSLLPTRWAGNISWSLFHFGTFIHGLCCAASSHTDETYKRSVKCDIIYLCK